MLRCAATHLKLMPLARHRSPHVVTSTFRSSQLQKYPSTFRRRPFSTTTSVRLEKETIVKQQEQNTKKVTKASKGDLKRLFQLAKPEVKSLSAATGLLVISSSVTMVGQHYEFHTILYGQNH
ncbi:hypothetical protein BDF20DRAFT_199720 [Mycotypha africana]|uniref:uncharacterized protein n=1 Tax=Mycotypha africana TaxID=64632 RepID=UPI002300CB37|nr:uncharacterized protein BDF20DRAFT_199720 [Mycotypha africana]KAI8967936.1 hypothetical protein BDF20DRAFT_199720 [Mycotypha africana]